MIKSPLRWVGSKSRIADFILEHAPKSFNDYYEPFLGGGAIFLAVKQKIGGDRNWYLSDINPHLICWWQAAQSDIHNLVSQLEQLKFRYENGDLQTNYWSIRSEFNERVELDTKKAALFMFLCKTAFNGLVRYNRYGQFNSAFGNRTGQLIDIEKLFQLSGLLQSNVHFKCHSYEQVETNSGDFVFLDPPYTPTDDARKVERLYGHKFNTGRKYSAFEHMELANWCKSIKDKKSLVMMTNHDTQLVRQHYSDFGMISYELWKRFSGYAKARKKTTEVLICSY